MSIEQIKHELRKHGFNIQLIEATSGSKLTDAVWQSFWKQWQALKK